MFLSLFRAIKFSIQDIFRNIWLSLVTVIILILALFTVNMLIVVKVVGQTAVDAIREKVDINLFLKNDATEERIKILQNKISSLSEVREVTYISRENALEEFRKKHQDNPEILEAMKELGKNPLTPILVIKPKDVSMFDELINQLNIIEDDIIESRNFANYKIMLDKINAITDKVSDAALFLFMIFLFITILVIYNSVRVAIYTHKKEIMIMRLVGASNWFIQMPYLISSFFYTFLGVVFVMLIFWPFLNLLQPYLETFFVTYNVNLVKYFYSDALRIFGIQFLAASMINVFASLLAVKKYSNI